MKEPLPLIISNHESSLDPEHGLLSPVLAVTSSFDYAEDIDSHSTTPSMTWPHDWHAIDIVKGFEACDLAARSSSNHMQDTFVAAFPGAKYTRGAFYAHCEPWNSAPEDIKKKYINYRHTDEGLWRWFMGEVPEPCAPLRNARKKLGCGSSQS